jgi:copper chaperone CopZ
VTAVQSALESVKGVKEAKVLLECKLVPTERSSLRRVKPSYTRLLYVVKYEPDKVKLEDLIKAVKNAPGMGYYETKVKEGEQKKK